MFHSRRRRWQAGVAERAVENERAIFAARWQISVRSAPVYFSVLAAKKSRSTSEEIGDFRKVAFRIDNLDSRSGIGM